jgi:hypothetical protein
MIYTAQKLLALYADYLRPRIKMIRPRGYERPSESRTDIRFQAWLRVVTEPTFLDYERDLNACLVKCDGDVWQAERIAEFEMALSESLEHQPFVHRGVEDTGTAPDSRDALVPLSAAAMACGVVPETLRLWTNKGLKCEKRGSYYWVNVLEALAWKDAHFMPQRSHRKMP